MRNRLEAGVLLAEEQVDGSGGPVALLADVKLRLAFQRFAGRIRDLALVHLRPVEEEDQVGILLDRP